MLIMTQFAFTKANANIVVPYFTSINIVIAVFANFISLNEVVTIIQLVEIIVILFGVILLTSNTSKHRVQGV